MLANSTLTIRLEARVGQWYPDGDGNPGVAVKAFSADGGPLQVPGPLIRVKRGTTVRASIRNATTEPLAVHGLYARPGSDSDVASPLVVAPGEAREVTFVAATPGIYYYWGAADAATPLAQRLGRDTQLTGAFVVDPAEPTPDRVIVFSTYVNDRPLGDPARVVRFAMNGDVMAAHRAADLQRGRYRPHTTGERRERGSPHAPARVLLQRGHAW